VIRHGGDGAVHVFVVERRERVAQAFGVSRVGSCTGFRIG
jgi:hypothetical protein